MPCSIDIELTRLILALTQQRGPDKSLCPSEVARQLAGESGDWRPLMDDVRRVGATLADARQIEITQGGIPVCLAAFKTGRVKGPVRFRLGPCG